MVAGSYMHGGKSIGGKGGSMNLQGQSANAAANMNNLRLRNLKGGKLLNQSWLQAIYLMAWFKFQFIILTTNAVSHLL